MRDLQAELTSLLHEFSLLDVLRTLGILCHKRAKQRPESRVVWDGFCFALADVEQLQLHCENQDVANEVFTPWSEDG